jgi:hypothetical protein
MRKEHTVLQTVGDLRKFLDGLPEDMPVVRQTRGHYQIYKSGDVAGFVGRLPIGHDKVEMDVLSLSA